MCVFPGGHDNFRKMIDEAEPLGYPVVVKNARGHRGKTIRVFLPVTRSIHNATPQKKKKSVRCRPLMTAQVHPYTKFINGVLND